MSASQPVYISLPAVSKQIADYQKAAKDNIKKVEDFLDSKEAGSKKNSPGFMAELSTFSQMMASQRWFPTLNKNATQEDVLKEAEKSHMNTIAFTEHMIEGVLQKIQEKLDLIHALSGDPKSRKSVDPVLLPLLDNYKNELVDIKKKYKALGELLAGRVREKKAESGSEAKSLELIKSEEQFLFAKANPMTVFISQLGGRFYSFKQAYDPLFGAQVKDGKAVDSVGSCFGYVKDWAQAIKQEGSAYASPALSRLAFVQQSGQSNVKDKQKYSEKCDLKTDYRSMVGAILDKMKPTIVYEIAFSEGEGGHSMGIRQVTNATNGKIEYEFFDPNLGIAIFDNKETMKIWLSAYLCNKYTDADCYYLNELGLQNPSAKASIQPFSKAAEYSPRFFTVLESSAKLPLGFTTYDAIGNLYPGEKVLLQELHAFQMLPLLTRDQKLQQSEVIVSQFRDRLDNNIRFNNFKEEFKLPRNSVASKAGKTADDAKSILLNYELNLQHELVLRRLLSLGIYDRVLDQVKDQFTLGSSPTSFLGILENLKSAKIDDRMSKETGEALNKLKTLDLKNLQQLNDFNEKIHLKCAERAYDLGAAMAFRRSR